MAPSKKTAAANSSSASKILSTPTSPGDEEAPVKKAAAKKAPATKKTVEEIYQKKTQLEHILLRPDTYIGSTEAARQPMWVWDSVDCGMVMREVSYVPGFYKIFDEILVNAADNKVH